MPSHLEWPDFIVLEAAIPTIKDIGTYQSHLNTILTGHLILSTVIIMTQKETHGHN
jgi:type II secretory ATPase GspE/PulE/Tfp pilus assembly ATPase PilB-like protein